MRSGALLLPLLLHFGRPAGRAAAGAAQQEQQPRGCANFGNATLCVAGGQRCFECRSLVCSSDDADPTPPNCGARPVAEPDISLACANFTTPISPGGATVGDARRCAQAAAEACDADVACASFSLRMDVPWAAHHLKLWRNNGTGLVTNAGWSTWVPLGAPAPTPAPTPAPAARLGCSSDLDCALNGVCDATTRTCVCDRPWSGASCQLLRFKPVSFPQGYGMVPNATTWGGNTIYDAATDTHHLFASRMTNDCLLDDWRTNSRIDHAVSTTGAAGPYVFKDVAVPTWSHNAAPLELPDGTFAIVHIGAGAGPPDGGANCTPPAASSSSSVADASAGGGGGGGGGGGTTAVRGTAAAFDGGSTIHVATSLDGPWTPLATTLGGCNNPAPWVHPNGTIFVGCGSTLKRADNLTGPFVDVATFRVTQGGPHGAYEDPQIYTDKRGHFHCLYHVYTTNYSSTYGCFNSTVAAHGFSQDGHEWHMSPVPPYTSQVMLDTGVNITVATRERPKPFFQDGVMTHLFNGVCGSPTCVNPPDHPDCAHCKMSQWDFTLAAPLDV